MYNRLTSSNHSSQLILLYGKAISYLYLMISYSFLQNISNTISIHLNEFFYLFIIE